MHNKTYDDAYTAGRLARIGGIPWLDAFALADSSPDREAFLDGWQDAEGK